MKRVGWLSDPIFLEHDTGALHPESPKRLRAIEEAIAPLRQKLTILKFAQADLELIAKVHTRKHIETIKLASRLERAIDSDTICSRKSYEATLYAVGAGVGAIDAIRAGKIERAFCAVRPPGHHATPAQAMGFCLFNNVATTARYAQSQGYQKVAIVDFDVHHGNGTQEVFYEDSDVLYISTHQQYAYPGTGGSDERGAREGEGYTLNFPLPSGSGDDVIVPIYQNEITQAITDFSPDIVLVSAGYDLHESDPLASFDVSFEGVRQIVRAILDACDAPQVFFLEGGYDPKALGRSVAVTLEEMLRA